MNQCYSDDELQQARLEKYDLRVFAGEVHDPPRLVAMKGRKPLTPILDRMDVGTRINGTCGCNCPVVWQPANHPDGAYKGPPGTDPRGDHGDYVHRSDRTPAGNNCEHQ